MLVHLVDMFGLLHSQLTLGNCRQDPLNTVVAAHTSRSCLTSTAYNTAKSMLVSIKSVQNTAKSTLGLSNWQ